VSQGNFILIAPPDPAYPARAEFAELLPVKKTNSGAGAGENSPLDIPDPICLILHLKEESWTKGLFFITFIFILKRVTHKAIPDMGMKSHG